MGIRYLNAFLKNNCKQGISKIHMEDLSGCSIVIDASIYLYQYEMDNKLIESMDKLVNIMNMYNINPTFVFDGKPPVEKTDIINERKERRKQACIDCKELMEKINDSTIDSTDKNDLITEYEILKRTSVFITREKINRVKKLFDEKNISYYDAPSEADELCAKMVQMKQCWGCMSDDMDMFVYGCNNVIRNVDIENHTAMLYNLTDMLSSLNITYENFKSICIISGTDYNKETSENDNRTSNHINLYTALKLYNRFIKKVKYDNMTFYAWLKYYIKYDMDYESLHKIYNMFTIDNCSTTITVS